MCNVDNPYSTIKQDALLYSRSAPVSRRLDIKIKLIKFDKREGYFLVM